MPKISIYEIETSPEAVLKINNNTVFIPGYAITGPVNTPILCKTLKEFQKIFGEKPYKFSGIQEYPDGFSEVAKPSPNVYAYSGAYEKSYIYAAQLLKNGLPVLYERVMKEDEIENWTAKIDNASGEPAATVTISSKYPGKYGTDIRVKFYKKQGEEYTLEFKTDETSKPIKKVISLDDSSENYWEKFESDLIKIKIKNIPAQGDLASIPNNASENTTTFENLTLPQSNTEEFVISNMYDVLKGYGYGLTDHEKTIPSLFEALSDKGEYELGFITSGAYPTFEYDTNSIVAKMLEVAGKRGNSCALIDYVYKPDRQLEGVDSIHGVLNEGDFPDESVEGGKAEKTSKYGAMFSPYALYSTSSSPVGQEIMPPSYAYLRSLAESIKSNANWYAVAGVTRGLVPELIETCEKVTTAIGEEWQTIEEKRSINPILNIKPYGYCIWGNRTLLKNIENLSAGSLLNIRVLADDVKEVVYRAAKKLTFEFNSDVLWLNFKAQLEPMLDKIVSGNGLSSYEIRRVPTDKKATIEAVIKLYVIEPVEDFEITIELDDTTILVQ